jgi:hypothetical protein
MSIWGPHTFENDDAADWIAELEEDPALSALQEALSEVSDPAHIGYLDVTDCCEAVAAAEVLTEILGVPGAEPQLDPEEAATLKTELEREKPREQTRLLQQALSAIAIVVHDYENSELRQLWQQNAAGMPEWLGAMEDLQRRLRIALATGERN